MAAHAHNAFRSCVGFVFSSKIRRLPKFVQGFFLCALLLLRMQDALEYCEVEAYGQATYNDAHGKVSF